MHRQTAAFILIMVLGSPAGLAGTPAQGAQADSVARVPAREALLSAEVQHIADWAVHSRDHKDLPFIIVDKRNAKAVAYDHTGKLLRSTPVLIGMGVGDTFAPGVLEMEMHQTKPSQRITPAGRYFADEDFNDKGERVLWVDYDAGIALHKLPAKSTRQRRHERIRSPNPADHRITYGCINVPAAFYDQIVHPQFRAKGGIVYVLPDSTSAKAMFKSYDVAERRVSNAQPAGPRSSPPQTQQF